MLNHHAPSDIAALKERLLAPQPGQEYLLQLLLQQEEPVTLVMTGNMCYVASGLLLDVSLLWRQHEVCNTVQMLA
jgi:inosine-uridine nucleoside N-ribohydrolase